MKAAAVWLMAPRYTPRVCGAAVGCGMRVAAAWRLLKICLTCLTCLSKRVRPCIPRGLPAAVWYGSGEDVPQGYARQLDGNGGMRVAAAWRRENGG